MWPVIIRELRVAGRFRGNNWYRVLAAGLVLALGLFTRLFDATRDGRELFAIIHQVLFWIIWIFVPLATADCISKERREGTLGLLFLTPLKSWDVVIAKSLVHASRAVFLWLAVVPIFTLSLLMGGVTKADVMLSVLIHFSSVCCGLAAGIAVSGLFSEWSRVIVAASFASALLLLGYLHVQSWAAPAIGGPVGEGLRFILTWQNLARGQGPGVYAEWIRWMFVVCAACVALLAGIVILTGLVVRRTINSQSRNSRLSRFGTRILFPTLHRNWSRKRLFANPVGWLEQRTWTARTLQWGWVGIMIAVYAVLAVRLDDWMYELSGVHRMLGWGLLAALGLTAAGSLRRERENGMLSLLLITPLKPDQLVLGRVKGLWTQIRWATILFVGGWIYLRTFDASRLDYFWMLFFVVSYFTLPVTALFCSLWRKSYFAAVLWTAFLGMVYPLTLGLLWSLIALILTGLRNLWPTFLVMAALVQIWVAYIRGRELIRKLQSRAFAL